MPGELDRKADGTAAMFSVGETPWHREGVVMDKPPATIDDALELAGTDFDVKLQPIFIRSGSRLRPVDEYCATYRTDRGQVLGVVGSRYQPLQNRDAFRVLEPLIDKGVAVLETAGSLRGGRDVWMLVRFVVDDPVVREVFAGEVVPFGLLSNNHAGERRVILQETPIRVVCANTLGAAHRTATDGRVFRVAHTVNVEARTVDAARSLWAALIERLRAVAEQYRRLRDSSLTDHEFQKLVLDTAAPISTAWSGALATTSQKRALERTLKKRKRLAHLWLKGRGHRGDKSAWEAYNAAVEALDHDGSLWPSGSSRVASLLEGHLGARKQKVLDRLMEHVLSQHPIAHRSLETGPR
jgi:phage/plasmid-like protein (TIGR03299 family)